MRTYGINYKQNLSNPNGSNNDTAINTSRKERKEIMENITLAQCKEMDEVQLRDMLCELFLEKYKDMKVSKITFTVNFEKENANIVLKY
jgi:hypothetical protein